MALRPPTTPPRKINVLARPAPKLQVPAKTVLKPGSKPLVRPTAAQTKAVTSDAGSLGGGFQKARAIAERNEARANRPFEFSMKVGEGGPNGVTVIFVDMVKLPNLPYFHYIHRWGFEEGERNVEPCLQEHPEGCDLCRSQNRKGSYEMVLTCIDTRPYTHTKGPKAGQTTPRSKRPYIITQGMIPRFERMYKEKKTFRGMVCRCFRDNKKSSRGGSQVEIVRMLTEAELAKYGELSRPFDYAKIYPIHTNEQLREMYGLDGSVGHGSVGDSDFAKGPAGDDDLPF